MQKYTGLICCLLQVLWIANGSTDNIMAKSNNDLAIKLYNQLAKKSEENIIISPLSIDFSLAGLSLGADNKTGAELRKALNLPVDENVMINAFKELTAEIEDDKNVTMATNLFHDPKFEVKKSFVEAAKEYFDATIGSVDFHGDVEKARLEINQWVANNTNNTIKDFYQKGQLSSATVAVLINAIHFKADWVHPFKKESTEKGPFISLRSISDVDMMHGEHRFNYTFSESLNSHILDLPYKGDYSMLLIVPKEDGGIVELERAIRGYNSTSPLALDSIFQEMVKTKISLTLPKFKVESTVFLKDALKKLGVSSIFKPHAFPELSDNPGFAISEIMQKAYISVDETSTEAAAATGTGLSSYFPEEIIDVKADHPFMYAIRHNPSGILIFVGRLMK